MFHVPDDHLVSPGLGVVVVQKDVEGHVDQGVPVTDQQVAEDFGYTLGHTPGIPITFQQIDHAEGGRGHQGRGPELFTEWVRDRVVHQVSQCRHQKPRFFFDRLRYQV